MTTAPAKRGRKAKDHKCSWNGETINGLYRKPGTNVWRVRLTGQEFTEPDERLAVAKFLRLAQAAKSNLGTVTVHRDALDVARELSERAFAAPGKSLTADIKRGPNGGWVVSDDNLSPAQWAWLRKQFLTRAKWVAQQVGLEELGWYDQWRKPAAAPSLLELGTLYTEKPKLTDNERSRSKLYWAEFARAVEVRTVDQIDHEAVARYEKWLKGQKLSAKSSKHRIAKVRTVLAYALKRGKNVRKALDACQMLEIPPSTSLDPRPIPVKEF